MSIKTLLMKGGALVFVTIAVVVSAISLTGQACHKPKCCPKAIGKVTVEEWVCPKHCPGGGKAVAYGAIEYEKEGERCDPPKDLKIYIYNKTDKTELPPPKIDKGEVGVYSFRQELILTKNTEFEVRAVGEDKCIKTVPVPIKVVSPGNNVANLANASQKKCGIDTPSTPSAQWSIELTTGPDIFVSKVRNPNGFKITVKHKSLNAKLDEVGAGDSWLESSSDPEDIRADGAWNILIDEGQCKKYNDLGQPPVKLDVTLRCGC